MFAQIKDYFVYRLTGEYYTDDSTASDHGFYDIRNRCYWTEMLDFVGIREENLPKIVPPGTEDRNDFQSGCNGIWIESQYKN